MAERVNITTAVVRRYGGTSASLTGGRDHGRVRCAGDVGGPRRCACRAALGIQEETKRLAVEVAERDGVALQLGWAYSGQVVAGEIGSAIFGYAPVGEQVGETRRARK